MKMIKKFLVMLLCFSLIFCSINGALVFSAEQKAVAKIGDTEFFDLQSAINAAQTGDEIDIISNVTVNEPITIPSAEELFLNGGQIVGATGTVGVVSPDYTKNVTFNGTGIDLEAVRANENYLKADINEDGTATATDLTLLRQKLIATYANSSFFQVAADINKDRVLDIRDLISFKKYLSRKVVYLSDDGNDSNVGDSETAPVKTLDRAIEQVYEGGSICIVGKYTAASTWKKHFKSVEITGGIYDASALSTFSLSDNVVFNNAELKLKDAAKIYADGHKMVIANGVSVSGKTYLYGGSTTAVDSTHIEVYSGEYHTIAGGGNGGNVEGDTYVKVGGNTNKLVDETDHSASAGVMGGGYSSYVGGNTCVIVCENAKAVYINGAGGGGSEVKGKSSVYLEGGSFMSAYAGSNGGKCYETELTMTGGTIEQIFGGCSGTSMTGNTTVNILGGTILRRIYGGCYNEATRSGLKLTWQSSYKVTGNTTVFLSSNAEIPLSYSANVDRGVFAGSRYKSQFGEEVSTIIYEDANAKSKFSSKLGQQDGILSLLGWTSSADSIITKS